jgi:hypothetical protein
MNVTLNGPGLESHPNSMLIAFWDEKIKKTRHIFVYAEVGKVHHTHRNTAIATKLSSTQCGKKFVLEPNVLICY